jgi:hypothetical protein
MNRRNALMTLLVISLAIGPFLFIVPSVYAKPNKPEIPEVIVVFTEDQLKAGAQYIWDPYDYEFPTEWKQVGETYDIIVQQVSVPGPILVRLLVPKRYENRIDKEALTTTLRVVQYGVKGDVNEDGFVNGDDVSDIAWANKEKIYVWEYDLAAPDGPYKDGIIDEHDIHECNRLKGQTAFWDDTLVTTVWHDEAIDRYYLEISAGHFSGWGIRR